jgi:hypothetical protein
LLWLALLLGAARSARAHDPFEITTDVHVADGELRVHTTMSLLTATRSCFDDGEARASVTPAEFEPLRAAFEACARDDYRVTSGGEVLPLRSTLLNLGVEGDLEMWLAYATPDAQPARL